jgi:hypothetical protein
VSIIPFLDPPVGGETVTAAVDRYLDPIKTRTTRSSYQCRVVKGGRRASTGNDLVWVTGLPRLCPARLVRGARTCLARFW